ncbi:hypothetical protein [Afipia sp. P52-10]|uniref:hypothetical protein n=1 Tax=Afipia sp. P52-10 TaxID=1429916 RepID=UPI001FCA527D|nr:hypothetical protein [Afipia sp. P52-10]
MLVERDHTLLKGRIVGAHRTLGLRAHLEREIIRHALPIDSGSQGKLPLRRPLGRDRHSVSSLRNRRLGARKRGQRGGCLVDPDRATFDGQSLNGL